MSSARRGRCRAAPAGAGTADVDVILDVTAPVPHVFQGFYPILDEAAAALHRAGRFLSAHLGGAGLATG